MWFFTFTIFIVIIFNFNIQMIFLKSLIFTFYLPYLLFSIFQFICYGLNAKSILIHLKNLCLKKSFNISKLLGIHLIDFRFRINLTVIIHEFIGPEIILNILIVLLTSQINKLKWYIMKIMVEIISHWN